MLKAKKAGSLTCWRQQQSKKARLEVCCVLWFQRHRSITDYVATREESVPVFDSISHSNSQRRVS